MDSHQKGTFWVPIRYNVSVREPGHILPMGAWWTGRNFWDKAVPQVTWSYARYDFKSKNQHLVMKMIQQWSLEEMDLQLLLSEPAESPPSTRRHLLPHGATHISPPPHTEAWTRRALAQNAGSGVPSSEHPANFLGTKILKPIPDSIPRLCHLHLLSWNPTQNESELSAE